MFFANIKYYNHLWV
jgi:hypothetical protein